MAGLFSSDLLEDLFNRAGAQAKKLVVAGEESRSNEAFGSLGTADKVTGLVLPTDGLIFVLYSALVKASFGGRVALFLNATQLQAPYVTAAGAHGGPSAQAAPITTLGKWSNCVTSPAGLVITGGSGDAGAAVTTGQVVGFWSGEATGGSALFGENQLAVDKAPVGSICAIFAEAGTYEVGAQFRTAGGGTISAKERKLWAWVKQFS